MNRERSKENEFFLRKRVTTNNSIHFRFYRRYFARITNYNTVVSDYRIIGLSELSELSDTYACGIRCGKENSIQRRTWGLALYPEQKSLTIPEYYLNCLREAEFPGQLSNSRLKSRS